jgi:YD repeat-containing protein
VTDALSHTTTYTTDSLGRVTAVTDPLGNVSIREFDPNNDRVATLIDPQNNTTQILYDGMGDVKSVTLRPTAAAPAGATIHYYYDNRNRLHIRTDALTQSESWLYWRMGELKLHTDRKGQTTAYNYDALERPSQIQYDDGSIITLPRDIAWLSRALR